MFIKVQINKQDIFEWLMNPDEYKVTDEVKRLAAIYAQKVADGFADLHPDDKIEVNLTDVYNFAISVDELEDTDNEYEVLWDLDKDYDYITSKLADFNWI